MAADHSTPAPAQNKPLKPYPDFTIHSARPGPLGQCDDIRGCQTIPIHTQGDPCLTGRVGGCYSKPHCAGGDRPAQARGTEQ
jgi:hypothetical protein